MFAHPKISRKPQFNNRLVEGFAKVLTLRLQGPICDMWQNNSALQTAILNLDKEATGKILKNVLSSKTSSVSHFMKDFVNFIRDDSVIVQALETARELLAKNPRSYCLIHRVALLEERLNNAALDDTQEINPCDITPSTVKMDLSPEHTFQSNHFYYEEFEEKRFEISRENMPFLDLSDTVMDLPPTSTFRTLTWQERTQSEYDALLDIEARILFLQNQIHRFRKALSNPTHSMDKIIFMYNWPLLREWFMGVSCNLGSATFPEMLQIPSHKMIYNFQFALLSHCAGIIDTFFKSCDVIKEWLCGKFQNEYQKLITALELKRVLEHTFRSHALTLIEYIFNGNKTFVNEVNPRNTPRLHHTQLFSDDELLNLFRHALSMQYCVFILKIYDENIRLHKIIQTLPDMELQTLLDEVLKSSKAPKNRFIVSFLNNIKKRSCIEGYLKELQSKYPDKEKTPTMTLTRMTLLEERLTGFPTEESKQPPFESIFNHQAYLPNPSFFSPSSKENSEPTNGVHSMNLTPY